jgi:hypothetical protein
VSALDVAKSSVEAAASNFKIMRSHQTSLGVQHDLGPDMVLKVDWARRQFENVDLGGAGSESLQPPLGSCHSEVRRPPRFQSRRPVFERIDDLLGSPGPLDL